MSSNRYIDLDNKPVKMNMLYDCYIGDEKYDTGILMWNSRYGHVLVIGQYFAVPFNRINKRDIQLKVKLHDMARQS